MLQLAIMFALFWYAPIDPSIFVEPASASKPTVCRYLSNENAERILGGPVTVADSNMKDEDIGRSWRCTFVAAAVDAKTGSAGKLHFMFTTSPTNELAASVFDSIRRSNEKSPGFELWNSVGDEALTHSDGKNFHLVIVRKGETTIRMKANPVGGATLTGMKDVAAEIAAKLNNGASK